MSTQSLISNAAPRVSLLDKDLKSMTEDELREFVQQVRATRNSQQLAIENKPVRKARTITSAQTPTQKAKLMAALLSDDDEE